MGYGKTLCAALLCLALAPSPLPADTGENAGRTSPGYAQDDAGCVRGGCSGEICQDARAELVMTPCAWDEEVICYGMVGRCARTAQSCQWEDSPALRACLSEGRAAKAARETTRHDDSGVSFE